VKLPEEVVLMVTVCEEVYVPAGGEKVGVAAVCPNAATAERSRTDKNAR